MKKCSNCGIQYDDSKVFCSECGSELVSLTQEENLQLTNKIKKDKLKKNIILTVICLLVLAILVNGGIILYPKVQVQIAINAVEKDIGGSVFPYECWTFTVDDNIINNLDQFVLPGKYIYIKESIEAIYFIRMNGLLVDQIYDYNFYSSSSIVDILNEDFLNVFDAFNESIRQGKAKMISV